MNDLVTRLKLVMDAEEIGKVGWPPSSASVKSEADVVDNPMDLPKMGFRPVSDSEVDSLLKFLLEDASAVND